MKNYYDFLEYPIKVSSVVLNSLTLILGVPGNLFVLYVAGMKMKRTVNTIWFLNLATADLLCCISIPLRIMRTLHSHSWPYGSVMCKIYPFAVDINIYASVFILSLISLDRFAQVVRPVWAQNHRSLLLARISCAAAWFLALLLSLPFMVLRETRATYNTTHCYLYQRDQSEIYKQSSVIRFVFGFLIPLICISTCYGFITRKLGQSQFRSGRAFRIMLAVIVAFFLCWLPYHMVELIRIYGYFRAPRLTKAVRPLAISLAYFNSCLNPILYVFMGQDFKNRVKLSLRHVFERAFSEEETKKSRSTQLQQIISVSRLSQNLLLC